MAEGEYLNLRKDIDPDYGIGYGPKKAIQFFKEKLKEISLTEGEEYWAGMVVLAIVTPTLLPILAVVAEMEAWAVTGLAHLCNAVIYIYNKTL